MAKPFDDEYHGTRIIEAIKAGLNAKIAAINAEKNDSITLRTVESGAYYYDTWGAAVPNYDPCVIFAVNVQPTGTVGDHTSQRIEILVQLVHSSTIASDPLDLFKVNARYRRALKEVAEETFQRQRVSIIPLAAVPFAVKTGGLYYAVGVGVELNII
jgi:hypothetical protein